MSVSPKWPDERKKPQFQEGNPDVAEPTGPPDALPPTLFQLPNLQVAHNSPAKTTESSDSTSTLAGQYLAPQVARLPLESVGFEGIQAAQALMTQPSTNFEQLGNGKADALGPSAVGGDETHATASPAEVNRELGSGCGASKLSPENKKKMPLAPIDRPAGRSWMDSIGSHGIVVALLLVVVAAALYTGRVSKDDSDAASLADGRDWLEYGTDDEISLPKAAVADGSTRAPIEEPERVLRDANQPNFQSGPHASVEVASAESWPEEDSSTSSALLSQPWELDEYLKLQSAVAEDSSLNASESILQQHTSTVARVSPAATRKEDLSRQPRQSGQPAAYQISVPASRTPTYQAPTYQSTATPSGIPDWSKYFPRVPSGNTVNPTYPSPSN